MDTAEGLRPEAVEQIDFVTVRRGYEPDRVRSRLQEAAAEIRRLNTVVQELSERLSRLESTPPERLAEARLAELLGDEALKVLQVARDAAEMDEKTNSAIDWAAAVLRGAGDARDEMIERAESERAEIIERAHAAAAAIVEEGRNNGRQLVQQAKDVRERMLADLSRKRKLHRREVEQLRTIRDRLLESLTICRQGLSGWVEELVQVVPQARAAAERAGLRIEAEREATVTEIEAEIEAGRLMGLPLDEVTPDALNEAEDSGWDAGTGEEAASTQDGPGGGETGSGAPEESGDAPEQSAEPGSLAGVGLYDMEAEALDERRPGAGPRPRPAPFGAEWTPPPRVSAPSEPAASVAGEPAGSDAAVTGEFVRSVSPHSNPESAGSAGVVADEPGVADAGRPVVDEGEYAEPAGADAGEPAEPAASDVGKFVEPAAVVADAVDPAADDMGELVESVVVVADAGEFDEVLEEDLDEPVEPAATGRAVSRSSDAGDIFARLRAVGGSTTPAPAGAVPASEADAEAAPSSSEPQSAADPEVESQSPATGARDLRQIEEQRHRDLLAAGAHGRVHAQSNAAAGRALVATADLAVVRVPVAPLRERPGDAAEEPRVETPRHEHHDHRPAPEAGPGRALQVEQLGLAGVLARAGREGAVQPGRADGAGRNLDASHDLAAPHHHEARAQGLHGARVVAKGDEVLVTAAERGKGAAPVEQRGAARDVGVAHRRRRQRWRLLRRRRRARGFRLGLGGGLRLGRRRLGHGLHVRGRRRGRRVRRRPCGGPRQVERDPERHGDAAGHAERALGSAHSGSAVWR